MLRGGAFYYDSTNVRCAVRNRNVPGFRDSAIGFRVALSPFRSDL